MNSDLHTRSMDPLEEVHNVFAYRFQKWQPQEMWQNEIFETEVCICNLLIALKLKQVFFVYSFCLLFFYFTFCFEVLYYLI